MRTRRASSAGGATCSASGSWPSRPWGATGTSPRTSSSASRRATTSAYARPRCAWPRPPSSGLTTGPRGGGAPGPATGSSRGSPRAGVRGCDGPPRSPATPCRRAARRATIGHTAPSGPLVPASGKRLRAVPRVAILLRQNPGDALPGDPLGSAPHRRQEATETPPREPLLRSPNAPWRRPVADQETPTKAPRPTPPPWFAPRSAARSSAAACCSAPGPSAAPASPGWWVP